MIPALSQIEAIPLATAGEFELTDREARTLRSRLYAMNKAGHRRYRTQRDGPLIIVWRIR